MSSLFQLPDETLLAPVIRQFPGREPQIRSLASLLYPDAIPCRNLVIHGTEATGKTSVTESVLAALSNDSHELLHATIDAAQCVTGRHLFERIVASVAASVGSPPPKRCETLAQLSVALSGMLLESQARRFVLVLDAIDRQRDGPPTLVPALARLSEIIPCLTCVFIVTTPPAGFLKTPSSPYLHFPPYTKAELVRILSMNPPAPICGPSSSDDDDTEDVSEMATQEETSELWARFCAAVHDSLIKSACGGLPSFRQICHTLWPRFIAPVVSGTHSAREFSRLLIAGRTHFQDESLVNPSIVAVSVSTDVTPASTPSAGLTAMLPTAARLLLLSAYLASHNAARHDLTLFSTYYHGRKRRRGGGGGGRGAGQSAARGKHRKIARKLLGAHAFVFERMMAIFEAVRTEWVGAGSAAGVGAAGLDGDVGMALATLASLRLLVRVGAGDVMDRGGKWRVNVAWEAIRGIARSTGVDIEEWLVE